MTQTDVVNIVEEIEGDARDIRLAEHVIFQSVLEKKKKQSKRTILIAVAVSASLMVVWLLFHCLPLVLSTH